MPEESFSVEIFLNRDRTYQVQLTMKLSDVWMFSTNLKVDKEGAQRSRSDVKARMHWTTSEAKDEPHSVIDTVNGLPAIDRSLCQLCPS